MKIHNLAILGAGERGRHWAGYIKGSRAVRLATAADSDTGRLAKFRNDFQLEEKYCFRDYRNILTGGLKPDGVFVTTPPAAHAPMTVAFLKARIPVFLEKPMAAGLADAAKIVRCASSTGTPIQTGFNCRYAPFFEKIKGIVSGGELGQILSVDWKEVITPEHWAYYCRHSSYNRRRVIGSWLLEKCCHDLDLMTWIIDSRCTRVASFGNRSCFVKEERRNRYCSDGCGQRKECLFYDATGRSECVYTTGSDLVDHQSTIMEYENCVTACFSLVPLYRKNTRLVHIFGTRATLEGSWADNRLRLFPHGDRKKKGQGEVVCDPETALTDGHGGGDTGIFKAFLNYLNDRRKVPRTGVREGWEAMVTGCAIDRALRTRRVVKLDTLRKI